MAVVAERTPHPVEGVDELIDMALEAPHMVGGVAASAGYLQQALSLINHEMMRKITDEQMRRAAKQASRSLRGL